ncbi:hypothetical protein Dimus_038661 [Dionaea muscipula]
MDDLITSQSMLGRQSGQQKSHLYIILKGEPGVRKIPNRQVEPINVTLHRLTLPHLHIEQMHHKVHLRIHGLVHVEFLELNFHKDGCGLLLLHSTKDIIARCEM